MTTVVGEVTILRFTSLAIKLPQLGDGSSDVTCCLGAKRKKLATPKKGFKVPVWERPVTINDSWIRIDQNRGFWVFLDPRITQTCWGFSGKLGNLVTKIENCDVKETQWTWSECWPTYCVFFPLCFGWWSQLTNLIGFMGSKPVFWKRENSIITTST